MTEPNKEPDMKEVIRVVEGLYFTLKKNKIGASMSCMALMIAAARMACNSMATDEQIIEGFKDMLASARQEQAAVIAQRTAAK